jgi:hypothetical protein
VTSGKLAQADAEMRIQTMAVGKSHTHHPDKDTDVTSGKSDKREERRKKASVGKGGGGAQV